MSEDIDVKKIYATLLSTSVFERFCEEEKSFFLVHAFKTRTKTEDSSWEFGFYNESKDRIVVFETEPVKQRPEEEVFKSDKSINPLLLDDVQVDSVIAGDIVNDFVKETYPGESLIKEIIILQSLDVVTWNFTLMTQSFSVINVKLNAVSGNIVAHKKYNLFDLGKPEI